VHTHRTKEIHGPFPFSGSVSPTSPNESSHGNILQLHVCSCGLNRLVNVNGNHIERSDWLANSDAVSLWKSVRMIQALKGSE